MDNTNKFPIAATMRFGHTSVNNPDEDQVTSKLPALHFYQLAIPAPKPTAGVDFDPAAASRGDALFSGKANCNACHREPLWTEPGWNEHPPSEVKIDSFQADRSPDGNYKTMNLAGIFVRERGLFMNPQNKGRFYHDGRFQTLLDVVKSYNSRFNLGLTAQEQADLVEYLKSLQPDFADSHWERRHPCPPGAVLGKNRGKLHHAGRDAGAPSGTWWFNLFRSRISPPRCAT